MYWRSQCMGGQIKASSFLLCTAYDGKSTKSGERYRVIVKQ